MYWVSFTDCRTRLLSALYTWNPTTSNGHYDEGCWIRLHIQATSIQMNSIDRSGDGSISNTGSTTRYSWSFHPDYCTAATSSYLCSTNDKGGEGVGVQNHGGAVSSRQLRGAQPGTYIVWYRTSSGASGGGGGSGGDNTLRSRYVKVRERHCAALRFVKTDADETISDPLDESPMQRQLERLLGCYLFAPDDGHGNHGARHAGRQDARGSARGHYMRSEGRSVYLLQPMMQCTLAQVAGVSAAAAAAATQQGGADASMGGASPMSSGLQKGTGSTSDSLLFEGKRAYLFSLNGSWAIGPAVGVGTRWLWAVHPSPNPAAVPSAGWWAWSGLKSQWVPRQGLRAACVAET
jgi:hypothetical protein